MVSGEANVETTNDAPQVVSSSGDQDEAAIKCPEGAWTWRFQFSQTSNKANVTYAIPGRGKMGGKQKPWAVDCYSIGRLLHAACHNLEEPKRGQSAKQVSMGVTHVLVLSMGLIYI